MNPQAAQQYLRTKVMTASPEQLQLMLFDGALRYCEQARQGLLKKNYEQVYVGVTRAQKIIVELQNSLRPKENPELCDRLMALYNFAYRKLIEAGTKHVMRSLEEAVEVIKFQRDTWVMLLEKLAKEKATQLPRTAAPEGSQLSMTG